VKFLSDQDLREFLEFKYHQYNRPEFIESDPISIPHRFTKKEDIEIAGFLTAAISWGTRAGILRNAGRLMEMMDRAPYDFMMNSGKKELEQISKFVHRTFNGNDCIFFIKSLKNCYNNYGGLEGLFSTDDKKGLKETISCFRSVFLELSHDPHVEKHIADPMKNASAKRILMFLRWMVRKDSHGVDFGIWKRIKPADLICPLDVHVGNVARKLGLLTRKSNDWKAAEELTSHLCNFDPADPVKYDFALFGLGIYERF
jgi:uncharacterized protein (TIGR02757 family)